MDKVSKTPRTNFVAHESGDVEWNKPINRFGRMMAHACILERELAEQNEPCTDAKEMGHGCIRAVKAENDLAAQKEQLRLCNVDQFSTAAELAEQKEQFRVLTDEMLVMMDERNAELARSNLLACALRSLLSKCACCGGTGEVGTGIIQMEHPAMMSCFVCAGERGILLKECGK